MTFEPEPGTRIYLNKDESIDFQPLEASGPASVFVYAESGKEGTVYKVLKNQDTYALKVFYPEYRDKRLLENTEKLSRFKELEGFRVAKRTVLTPETHSDLLGEFPELKYAVLMPWIEGTVWGNMMLDPDPALQAETYVQIAYALTRVVSSLELQGMAHCDLSNNNFIIAKSPSGIQLIDIEDMYAPDMPRPIPDVSYGSIGYRTRWIAERGLWGPESDRFALAILCSEIVAWHNPEIQENRSGNTSFFEEEEIGEDCDRYKLMTQYLEKTGDELPALLERAWFSTEFSQCPTVVDWREAVGNLRAKIAPDSAQYIEDQTHIPTIISRRGWQPRQEPVEIIPEPAPIPVEELQSAPGEVSEAETPVMAPEAMPEPEPPPVEVETSAQATIAVSRSEAIPAESLEQVLPESEAELPGEAEDQSQVRTVFMRGSDVSVPSGVPPKMEVELEILDFGAVGTPQNSQQFSIANSGGAVLNVVLQAEAWIDLSQSEFELAPGAKQVVTATLNQIYPRPKTGQEYRSASALTVESNAGGEVLGARFILPKPAFHETWWKRALLGAAMGVIFGCLALLLTDFDLPGLLTLPVVLVLCGLAGLAAYPKQSSGIFVFLGFLMVEFLVVLVILLAELEDSAGILLGLGSGLGLLGGALVSRVFYGVIRPPRPQK